MEKEPKNEENEELFTEKEGEIVEKGATELSSDAVLSSYGDRNPYQLWVFFAMAMCWCYIAPAGLLGPFAIGDMCINATTCNITVGSVIEEFNLVGDNAYAAEMAMTIPSLGNMIGSTILSHVSDVKGRRPVLLICIVGFGIFDLFSAFSPNIYVLSFLWMMRGVFSSGLGTINWVLAYESASMGLRPLFSLIFGITWVVGYVAVPPLCYYIRYWRHQLLFTAIPPLSSAAVYYFTVPESFHLCVVKGRTAEVKRWYQRMNTFSRFKRETGEVQKLIEQHQEHKVKGNEAEVVTKGLISGIMHNRLIQLYIVVFAYTWATDSFVYSGLHIISTSLAGNKYWNFALGGLIEIPSYLVCPYLLETVGRRAFGASTHLLTFIAFMATVFIDNAMASFVCWLIGKFAISCAFTAIFVYASEVFPTIYRSGCLGICMFISCFGGIAAGAVRSMNAISPHLPNVIFALASLLAAALTMLLPETKGKELPDNTEEMERFFGRKKCVKK
ncbi:unnamed protein product [Bursaphelenchus xylophilus]|uniref:(pine wood nematode) hypothetical protein n=1 Tax=Bursaphelenchus xylophilus TaxID=6326 RepID=A0A1I7RXT4_BURXY|nr:unnamed protein product [Bursaphelenchus xylophilus]CAG9125147.1 unnamed protein product [Bursaphelenchus xylophilus]